MGSINICNQRKGSVLLFKDCCSCSLFWTFLCRSAGQRDRFLGNVRRPSTGRDKLRPTRCMSTGKPYLKDYACPFDRELSSSAVLQNVPGIFVCLSNFLSQAQRGAGKLPPASLAARRSAPAYLYAMRHLPGRLPLSKIPTAVLGLPAV